MVLGGIDCTINGEWSESTGIRYSLEVSDPLTKVRGECTGEGEQS
jgi:hypothetical protein